MQNKENERKQKKGRVILLVDDDPTIRELGQEIFAMKGYQVLTAADGVEALQIYREHRREIGLVILDMVMPKMDGRETFYALRTLNPDIKVILSSGYSSEQEVGDLLRQGMAAFIPKPYNVQKFISVAEEVLNR